MTTTNQMAYTQADLVSTARQWDGLNCCVTLRNGTRIAGILRLSSGIASIEGQRLEARGKYSDEHDIVDIYANE